MLLAIATRSGELPRFQLFVSDVRDFA